MKVKGLKMLRGAGICIDVGELQDLDAAIAIPHIEAGTLERISGPETAIVAPAERVVVEGAKPEAAAQALPPWPPNKRIKKSPAEYLKATPRGKYADLAREHLGE